LGAIQPKGLNRKPTSANILNISNKPCTAELTTGRVIPSGTNYPPLVEVCSSTNKKGNVTLFRRVGKCVLKQFRHIGNFYKILNNEIHCRDDSGNIENYSDCACVFKHI
jgi:hypothetical protein